MDSPGPDVSTAPVSRRALLRTAVAVSAAVGGAVAFGFGGEPAAAEPTGDVAMLETSASLEKLLVSVYDSALALAFITGQTANAFLNAFCTKSRDQHVVALNTFNDNVTRLGGRRQTARDPVLADVVDAASSTLTGPMPVIQLTLKVETAALESYVQYVPRLADAGSRQAMVAVLGPAAQRAAVLQALRAALADPTLAVQPDLAGAAQLPAVFGQAGFPNGAITTDQSRPADEGAVG